jgi:hypothetical protein
LVDRGLDDVGPDHPKFAELLLRIADRLGDSGKVILNGNYGCQSTGRGDVMNAVR